MSQVHSARPRGRPRSQPGCEPAHVYVPQPVSRRAKVYSNDHRRVDWSPGQDRDSETVQSAIHGIPQGGVVRSRAMLTAFSSQRRIENKEVDGSATTTSRTRNEAVWTTSTRIRPTGDHRGACHYIEDPSHCSTRG